VATAANGGALSSGVRASITPGFAANAVRTISDRCAPVPPHAFFPTPLSATSALTPQPHSLIQFKLSPGGQPPGMLTVHCVYYKSLQRRQYITSCPAFIFTHIPPLSLFAH
jgi:hypothetical protein